MSSIGSLKPLLSGARYQGISSISEKQLVLSADQDCSILNSIDTFHSSLTYFSFIEMVAEPIVPQGAFCQTALFPGRFIIHFTIYQGENGNFFRAPEFFIIPSLQ
jgi:hypothetical protein